MSGYAFHEIEIKPSENNTEDAPSKAKDKVD
jgi:hypothetical protein